MEAVQLSTKCPDRGGDDSLFQKEVNKKTYAFVENIFIEKNKGLNIFKSW